MTNNKPIAWLLTRVSSDGQQERGEGLDVQLAAIRGHAIVAGFPAARQKCVTETISGFTEKLVDRPKLRDVLDKAKRGDVLFWDKTDRPSRDSLVQEQIIREMAARGLRFNAAGLEYDLHDEEQLLILKFRGSMDHYAGKLLVARMKAGRASRRSKGYITEHNCPFGLRYLKADKYEDRRFEIVEDEARIVRVIADLYLSGKSVLDIAQHLQAHGVKTRTGRNWRPVLVSRLLRNPMICGRYFQGRFDREYKKANGKTTCIRKVANPRKDWKLLIEFDAIIPLHVWESIQARMDGATSKRTGRSAAAVHFLSQNLLCGLCGSKLRVAGGAKGRKGQYTSYFSCRWNSKADAKAEGRQVCGLPKIPTHLAQHIVWRAVRKIALDPQAFFTRFVLDNAPEAELKKVRASIKSLKSKLHTITSKIDRAGDMLLSASVTAARTKTLDAQLVTLEWQRERFADQLPGHEKHAADLEQVAGRLTFVEDNKKALAGIRAVARAVIDGLDDDRKRDLVRAVLNGLRLRVEVIDERAFKKDYRRTPGKKFAVDKLSPMIRTLTSGLVDVIAKDRPIDPAKKSLAVFQPILRTSAVAFSGSSKAKGKGWRLVPAGQYNPVQALSNLAGVIAELRPTIFSKYAAVDEYKNGSA